MKWYALDWFGPKITSICGAAAGSVSAAAAMLGDFALAVLGVPLPVVMSSAAGAGLARSFMEPTGFFRALGMTAIWTVLGCAGAPLAQALAPALIAATLNRDITLPANTLAALGAIIAMAPWWWPKLWPYIRARLPGGDKTGGGNA